MNSSDTTLVSTHARTRTNEIIQDSRKHAGTIILDDVFSRLPYNTVLTALGGNRPAPRPAGVCRKQHRHPAKASSKPAARLSPLLLVLAMRQFPAVASEHIRQAVEQQVQTLIAKNTKKAGA